MLRRGLILIGLFSLWAESASAVFPLPKWACPPLLQPVEAVEFNEVEFTATKTLWLEKIAAGEKLPTLSEFIEKSTSAGEAMAYLEAVAESSGSDLFRLADLMQTKPEQTNLLIQNLQRAVTSGDPFSWSETRALVTRLYSVANGDVRHGWKKILPVSANSAIAKHVQEILERETLSEAFRKIGFFREPTRYEAFKQWLQSHSYAYEIPLNAGLEMIGLHYAGTLLPPMSLHPLQWRELPKEWISAYRAGGLPAVEPLFRARFQIRGKVDQAWRLFQFAAGSAASGVAIYYIVTEPGKIWDGTKWVVFGVRSAFTDFSPEALQKHYDKNFDCEKVRKQKEKDWIDSYASFENGKKLTPESDPGTWEQLRRRVLTAPCDSLRTRFGSK